MTKVRRFSPTNACLWPVGTFGCSLLAFLGHLSWQQIGELLLLEERQAQADAEQARAEVEKILEQDKPWEPRRRTQSRPLLP
jgi:hypothetical protein